MIMDIITMVVCAILCVESSGGKDLRRGDGGRATGPYQMWTVAVDEANRIEKIEARREGRNVRRWRYSDRTSPLLSRQMCEVTMRFHYRRGVTDPVLLACRWHRPYGKPDQVYKRKIQKVIGGKK